MATEKEMETPLVLSNNAEETNPASNWNEYEKPAITQDVDPSLFEDNDDEVRGDYVGHRAAFLSTLTGVCIVWQIFSVPGALLQKWSQLDVVGKYYTNGTESDTLNLMQPSTSALTLFQLIKYFGTIKMDSLVVMGIISAFIIPCICITLNLYLAWAVHRLSSRNACILSKQEWRLKREEGGCFNKFRGCLESLATHEKIDGVLTFVEYGAKLSLYVVYFPAYATACLSAFPIVLTGDFSPLINHTIPHYNTTHQLQVEANMFITFGQFFFMLGAGFIVLSAILVRFQWYSNFPLKQDHNSGESDYSLIPHDDDANEVPASAFGKSISNPQQGLEILSENESQNGEKSSWAEDVSAKPKADDISFGGENDRMGWETSQNSSAALTNTTETNSRRDFWMRGILFETGLISLLLVAPISVLPMTRFHYKGLYQPLVYRKIISNRDGLYTTSVLYSVLKKDHTLTLTLWDIAIEYSRNSGISNLCKIVIAFFWLQICILPFVTLLLCVLVNLMGTFWKKMTRKKKKTFGVCVKLLRASYTGSNITTFAVTLISTSKVVPYLFENAFNKDKFCEIAQANIPGAANEKCLEVDVERFAGTWYLLAFGLSLDIFTSFTLHYFQTKEF